MTQQHKNVQKRQKVLSIKGGFKNHPFGSQTSRFPHQRNVPGADPHVGPGYYNAEKYKCVLNSEIMRKNLGPDWKRAYFVETHASLPHFLYREEYDLKKELKRKLGPGTYYQPNMFGDDISMNNKPGLWSLRSKTSRFPKERLEMMPCPGTYGIDGIPGTYKLMKEAERKYAGSVGLLSRGSKDRKFYLENNNMGPGTYKVKDATSEFLHKRTGNRNFYDCFSEDRSKITHGHWARQVDHSLGPGSYKTMPSSTDDFKNKNNSFKGKFMREVQYPEKPHQRVYWDEPGNVPVDHKNQIAPTTYSPKIVDTKVSLNKKPPPFLTSFDRNTHSALFGGNKHGVGPGRYDTSRWESTRVIPGGQSSFKSLSKGLTLEQEKSIRIRLRPKNVLKPIPVDHHSTEQSTMCDISHVFESRRLCLQ